jgi:hypothetical protein
MNLSDVICFSEMFTLIRGAIAPTKVALEMSCVVIFTVTWDT